MQPEGNLHYDTRRYGLFAGLRDKQWWSFEGLDAQHKLYFVFLALRAFPTSYVSLKVIDYERGIHWTEDHLGAFTSRDGERVDVSARGKWGSLAFQGSAGEGWRIDVQTPHVLAHCTQAPLAPAHENRLLTQHIDYSIHQFLENRCQGVIDLDGRRTDFSGYGYCEHNWGVQPRHSTAHWLHFWGEDCAGVALDCRYDAGIPHHYTLLYQADQKYTLASPVDFSFDPACPMRAWQVSSPDLDLEIRPLYGHATRMKIPPLLAYIDVDYYEQLLELEGRAYLHGQPVTLRGVGKFDFNWNRW